MLSTFAWHEHYSCSGDVLILSHGNSLLDARKVFVMTVIRSLSECYKSPYKVPELFGLDLVWYRRRSEMQLARNVLDVTDEQLTTWRTGDDGEPDMSDDVHISTRPQLHTEFR